MIDNGIIIIMAERQDHHNICHLMRILFPSPPFCSMYRYTERSLDALSSKRDRQRTNIRYEIIIATKNKCVVGFDSLISFQQLWTGSLGTFSTLDQREWYLWKMRTCMCSYFCMFVYVVLCTSVHSSMKSIRRRTKQMFTWKQCTICATNANALNIHFGSHNVERILCEKYSFQSGKTFAI